MSEAELPAECKPCERRAVAVDADEIELTDVDSVAARLRDAGATVARIDVTVSFDDSGLLAIQRESNRIRDWIRAANQLGADSVQLLIEGGLPNDDAVVDAVRACQERGSREGVTVDVRWRA